MSIPYCSGPNLFPFLSILSGAGGLMADDPMNWFCNPQAQFNLGPMQPSKQFNNQCIVIEDDNI